MPRYRVDWTEEVYTYVEADNPQSALEIFEDAWLSGSVETILNEFSEPNNVEVVASNGDITKG